MTDLKKLRELAEKANPGPWIEKRDPFDVERIHVVDQDDEIICSVRGTTRNSYFIATANPQAIIEILDRLERYEKALRFYADEKSWRKTREDELHQAIMTIVGDVDSYGYQRDEWSPNILQIIAGKAAREALEGEK